MWEFPNGCYRRCCFGFLGFFLSGISFGLKKNEGWYWAGQAITPLKEGLSQASAKPTWSAKFWFFNTMLETIPRGGRWLYSLCKTIKCSHSIKWAPLSQTSSNQMRQSWRDTPAVPLQIEDITGVGLRFILQEKLFRVREMDIFKTTLTSSPLYEMINY